jgi:hypothetical protein
MKTAAEVTPDDRSKGAKPGLEPIDFATITVLSHSGAFEGSVEEKNCHACSPMAGCWSLKAMISTLMCSPIALASRGCIGRSG